eukprot:COSAG02_NODE_3332_length_6919_cov_3.232551_4_plen_54_part_00
MRNKAAGAVKRGPRSGLGRSAAGKDGAEQGELVRLDRLRNKVCMFIHTTSLCL